jgi:hypothetical protein
MRNEMKEIVIDLHQPLEDLMSDYYEIVDSLEDLEKEELYRAAVALEPLEDYLIHMNVI